MNTSLKRAIDMMIPDSLRRMQLGFDSSRSRRLDSVRRQPMVTNNYFNYTGSYVSKLEGQYNIDGLFQHVFSYGATAQVTKELPVGIVLSGRKSNSPYFRDYLDFTIDARPDLIAKQVAGRSAGNRKEQVLRETQAVRSAYRKKLNALELLSRQLNGLIGDSCLSLYVRSREILASSGYYRDSLSFPQQDQVAGKLSAARAFVERYDSIHALVDAVRRRIDENTNAAQGAVSQLDKAIADLRSGAALQAALPVLVRYGKEISGFDTVHLEEKTHWLQRFRRLAVGRSMTEGSQLTMQDIAVKGLQAEYQADRYFYSVVAGSTDFGLRDFVFRNEQVKLNSLVYAATIGKGRKENDFVSLGVFGGKKTPGTLGFTGKDSGYVWGLSIAGQYRIRHWKVNAELAQSNGYRQQSAKPSGDAAVKDLSNKAAALKVSGRVRPIALQLAGFISYYGANFQGFNAYRINAANTMWGVEASKSFFHQSLQVDAAVKTNEYRNPYVAQVYDGRNTVQSFSVRYQKNRLTVAASYKPVYQYLGVNDSLFEGRFQVLQAVASLSYKTGDIQTSSSLLFNRFTSRQENQQYFFGDAYNLVGTQSFFFPKHSIMVSTSYMANDRYTYWLIDGCIQYRILPAIGIKMGGRMYALQSDIDQTRVGAYGGTYFTIKHIGQFSLRCESNYFPDLKYRLYGNTMATAGFSTNFK